MRDGSLKEVDVLWINEGFVLDGAGNMLMTSYIDLRDQEERTVIRSLVKGCKRGHALEDGETVLISKPERFREYGVALIRDEQEGFAREETVTLEPETPEEAATRHATSDLNDALQLVGSGIKPVHRVEYNKRKTQSESFSYGKDRNFKKLRSQMCGCFKESTGRGKDRLLWGPRPATFSGRDIYFNVIRTPGNATNPQDWTNAEIQGRRDAWTMFKLWKKALPEFKDAYFFTSGPMAGS